jgi:spectinomycin phosphotransferase
MLERPAITDEQILACLEEAYSLPIVQITFLPLGADRHSAVYRAQEEDGTLHFVKLRGGGFDEISVLLPKFLSDQGVEHLLVPRATRAGQLWASLGAFNLILYPYVEGHDGYHARLLDRHWVELGTVLRELHRVALPPTLARAVRRETYSPQATDSIRSLLARMGKAAHEDPIARELTAFLQDRRDQILDLVGRAERLAQTLQGQAPPSVLCHSDIHAGNILIDAGGAFYIVDWDEPTLAPKERDLMSVGAGLMGGGRTPGEEECLFYQGYGPTKIEASALAYYRYERIIQDIAIFSEEIFLADSGPRDRSLSLHYLMSNFLPGGTLELAYRSDRSSPVLQSGHQRPEY